MVHLLASPSIWLAGLSPWRGLSTNPGVTSGAYVDAVKEMMGVVCKYDLGKGDLFVMSWATVRRVRLEVSLQSC